MYILAQNSEVYATPTSGVLELVFAARGNYTNSPEFKAQDPELMKSGFLSFCKHGMKGYFEAITDKPYIIDKFDLKNHNVFPILYFYL